MNKKDLIKKVANELDFPEEVVKRVYASSWEFIKNHISELHLKEDLTEEQFKVLRTNFNLPSLGKLYVTYDDYKRIKEKYENYKQLKKYEQDT